MNKNFMTGLLLAFQFLMAGWGNAEITHTTNLTYVVRGIGGRVDWSDKRNLLVVDKGGREDLYAQTWIMDRNGAHEKSLTSNRDVFLAGHNGNPAWHPSGEYIVFQAQNPSIGKILSGTKLHKILTSPGAGMQNDIWIMRADGSQAWKITEVTSDGGVLHPHFSPDGTKLIWAEGISPKPKWLGTWVIRMADFSVKNPSQVSRIETLTPGNFQWYETHGFSPDGSSFLFTAMAKGGDCRDFDIYSYDLRSKQIIQLTDPALRQWDEHAHYTSDGKQIIWMSSMDQGLKSNEINQFKVKTDYWIMNRDGSNKKRITFFNEPEKERVIAADLTITGDGKYLFGYIQDPGLPERPGSIIRLDLK